MNARKATIVALAILCIVEAGAKAEDPVDFADDRLKQAVIQALAALDPPIITDDPTPTNMAALTILDAWYKGISKLGGIEHAVNLTHLDLRDSQISDLTPLANLNTLEYLHLRSSPISDLTPLENLTELGYLNLQSCQYITNIYPLIKLTKLGGLWIGGNQISDISPLSGMTGLGGLSLAGNQISNISPLSGMTSITFLDLNSNLVGDISPLNGMTKLRTLFMSNNQITDIEPVASLTGLTKLNLNYGAIIGEDITFFSGLTRLMYLNLAGTMISDVEPLVGLANVISLDVSESDISNLELLAGMFSLKNLRLMNSAMSDITWLEPWAAPGGGPQNLLNLYLNGNPLDCHAYRSVIPALEEKGITVHCEPMPPECLNQPPVANAGGPYLTAVGTHCSFDGSGSHDPDGDELTYNWDCGDEGTETGETTNHTYSSAGVYDVCLTVSDGTESDTECTYAVVYDPSAGFVTGGGWIDSPAGAYTADPSLTGKANFGFVSKYKKGAEVPTGQTEFKFEVASLEFHSSSYDWLVVNQGGTNAQFKGAGTINDSGYFKFMLWAGDGEPDTFRIKIWEENESGVETVKYDNGFDQAIAGGSIVIHVK